MMDDSCTPSCMARNSGKTISYKFTSFSISPCITSLTLIFFFLFLMAHRDDHHQEENPILPQLVDPSYGAKFKRQKISESSTRRDCRGINSTKEYNNAIHFSPIGRKGGRHSFKVYEPPSFSWRHGVFDAGAHEVPSGPNPISNR